MERYAERLYLREMIKKTEQEILEYKGRIEMMREQGLNVSPDYLKRLLNSEALLRNFTIKLDQLNINDPLPSAPSGGKRRRRTKKRKTNRRR